MKQLDALYLPVPDLPKALAFYRDKLGWKELWREGDTTAGLQLPGSDTFLMLDVDVEGTGRTGPIFGVEDVRAYHEQLQADLPFWLEPTEIPGGYWAALDDPFGHAIYVIDQINAGESSEP
jgi:catechol 2,3-dioxygenase-like lactoylglutathione lyase family enzyme